MSLTRDEEQITQIIDKVLEAREHLVRQATDPGDLRSGFSGIAMEYAQERYEKEYRAAIQEILHLIVHARRMP